MTILKSINPHSDETLKTYETFSDELIEQKIHTAHETFLTWKDTSFDDKKQLYHNLAGEIENNLEELATLQTIEM
jgi:succinate-semialdehyde dehydrogenase/glutarate-semialdehyde dehydrogenase